MDQNIFPILSRVDYAVTIMTALIRNHGSNRIPSHQRDEIVALSLDLADKLVSKDKEDQNANLQCGLRPVQD